jgi:hypothetical protein
MLDLEQRLDRAPRPSLQRLVRRSVLLFPISAYSRTKGATTHQPSGNALGNAITQQTIRALKARHQSEFRAFSAAASAGDTQTQGAASLWADEFWRLWRETRLSVRADALHG